MLQLLVPGLRLGLARGCADNEKMSSIPQKASSGEKSEAKSVHRLYERHVAHRTPIRAFARARCATIANATDSLCDVVFLFSISSIGTSFGVTSTNGCT